MTVDVGGRPAGSPSESPIDVVQVVVPARNEETLLPRCLAALQHARRTVLRLGVSVGITVVLDRCTDRSASVVLGHPGVTGLTVDAGLVGVARDHGIRSALSGNPDPARTWIAVTDADSAVHPEWLLTHLAAARSGTEVLLGSVVLDPDDSDPQALEAFRAEQREHRTPDRPRIYGANLGVRADRYLQVGGFPAVGEHEDVLLVQRLRAAGAVLGASRRAPVLTSGRLSGRTPGGFAGFLRAGTGH